MARIIKTLTREKKKKEETGFAHREHRSKKGRTKKSFKNSLFLIKKKIDRQQEGKSTLGKIL